MFQVPPVSHHILPCPVPFSISSPPKFTHCPPPPPKGVGCQSRVLVLLPVIEVLAAHGSDYWSEEGAVKGPECVALHLPDT